MEVRELILLLSANQWWSNRLKYLRRMVWGIIFLDPLSFISRCSSSKLDRPTYILMVFCWCQQWRSTVEDASLRKSLVHLYQWCKSNIFFVRIYQVSLEVFIPEKPVLFFHSFIIISLGNCICNYYASLLGRFPKETSQRVNFNFPLLGFIEP